MKNINFSGVIAIALVFLSFVSVCVGGGYVETCDQIRLGTEFVHSNIANVLLARCYDTNGGRPTHDLRLRNCIGNIGGALVWLSGGGFQGSCSNMQLRDGRILSADCKGYDQSSRRVELDLNERITNDNGVIKC